MQPMVNMTLRAIRSTVDQINLILEREELSFTRPETIDRVVGRINTTFYDNLSKALQRAYPKSHIAESGDLTGKKDGFSWHILPLHNVTSLVRGLSDWCFSVICKKNDQTEHAVIVFPATNEEYSASRGSGATLNDKRLRVSGNNDLSLSLISTNILSDLSNSDSPEETLNKYTELDKSTLGIRSGHCIPQQLVHVAAGKLDATLMKNIDPTETAAGLLIAREAGALSGDFEGRPITDRSNSIICGNPKILRLLTQKLN